MASGPLLEPPAKPASPEEKPPEPACLGTARPSPATVCPSVVPAPPRRPPFASRCPPEPPSVWKRPQGRLPDPPVCSAGPSERSRYVLAGPEPLPALFGVPQSQPRSLPCTPWPSRCFVLCPVSPRCALKPSNEALCGCLCPPQGWQRGFVLYSLRLGSTQQRASRSLRASPLAPALEPSIFPSTALFLPVWPRKDAQRQEVAAPFTAVLAAERLVAEELTVLPKPRPCCFGLTKGSLCLCAGPCEGRKVPPVSPSQLFTYLPPVFSRRGQVICTALVSLCLLAGKICWGKLLLLKSPFPSRAVALCV